MGYLFIIGLILILATIFAITILFDHKRIKKKANQALVKAKMFAWGQEDK